MTDNLQLLINALFKSQGKTTFPHCDHREGDNLLVEWIVAHNPHITAEKARLITSMYRDSWGISPEGHSENNAFFPLVHFVKDKAVFNEGRVKVKLEELLRWRQMSNCIGEDLMMASWLAYHFRWTDQKITSMTCFTPCPAFDSDLEYLYKKGLSDLHHHLKASTDVFTLSWICLMNHVSHRYKAFGKMTKDVPQLYKSFLEAAQIRTVLYEYAHNLQEEALDKETMDFDELLLETNVRQLQFKLNILREERKCGNGQYILDYALPQEIGTSDHCKVFYGEYALLFTILRLIFRGSIHHRRLTDLLFRYIQTKIKIRSCLVQVNEQVGFSNFSDYERRKELFLEGYPEYEKLLSLLPVSEAKRHHHLTTLETRIAPKSDYQKMCSTFSTFFHSWRKDTAQHIPDTGITVHFIKQNDSKWRMNHARHHLLRQILRSQAINLMTLRRQSFKTYYTLVGIDAANTELDCRPEVFAQTYRYIRKHALDMMLSSMHNRHGHQSLHYTYHAGEDFYDIVDGLRAIDEAIYFLGMENGDRLGHCIALGISAKLYYKENNHNIIIKKQYLLDNIAWLIYQAKRYAINLSSALETRLTLTYDALIDELYGRSAPMETYRMSMLLRGDNPYSTTTLQVDIIDDMLSDWNSCAFGYDQQLKRLRQNDEVRQLYYDYHFNERVRKKGDEMACLKTDKDYVCVVSMIQECMMREIRHKNIIIECCPSSNLKIGPASRYEQQPIFRFCPIGNERDRMPVTVNTDDLGIFQTSIDNDYSLLAISALKIKDEDGNQKYSKREVIQWLDEIRENGFKYSFVPQDNRNRSLYNSNF